ncbi:Xylulose kinase [Serratia odorifera]|uniref:Xylulose kinase n=1 Tax=Serratia odorifera TaxID=618 RepID=A0A447KPM3_SEROD|nr:Xylulose kinase [Serratia odorifera]
MYIGIDLGTSGVKAILLDEQGQLLASHSEALTVSARSRCGLSRIRRPGGTPPIAPCWRSAASTRCNRYGLSA